jgi:hypothetical protein
LKLTYDINFVIFLFAGHALFLKIADLVPRHPGRSGKTKAGGPAAVAAGASGSGTSGGGGGGGKKGGKKKK